MNTNKSFVCGVFAAIFALAFTACNPEPDPGPGPSPVTPAAITYTVTQTGGENNVSDSTGIVFTFNKSVDSFNLSAADITVSGAAENGTAALSGTGTTRTLAPITVNAAGLATVSINKDGIEAVQKSVTIYQAGVSVPEYWEIAWNLNGGEEGAGAYPTLIVKGEVLAQPSPNPTKAGNTFGGWYSDSGLTQTYNFANPVSANLSLYAKWEATVTHTHQWGAWSVSTAATCMAAGVGVRYCTECNEQDTNTVIPINPNAHQLDPNYFINPPTCTTAGTGALVCLLNPAHSNLTQQIVVPALGHEYQNWIETTAPTCTTAGVETGTCIRDHVTATRAGSAIVPTAHDWNTAYTAITPVTETTDGIEAITCKHNNAHTKEPRTLYATGTEGLLFTAINNSSPASAYRVNGGEVTSGAVHIPAYHRETNNYEDYKPVTAIGSSDVFYWQGAFKETNITAVTFAENSQLTSIHACAFQGCTSLASITIPASVTIIHQSAFVGCTSLTSISIPAGVTSIGYNVFYGWTSSQTIYVPWAEGNKPSEWSSTWDGDCDAHIVYQQ